MADCNETLREMYAFLDGELAPSLKTQIEAHLEGCHDCLGAFEFHYELRQLVAQRCRDDAPPGLYERILACFGDPAEPAAPSERADDQV
jgi:mycothiol system anti-sigma-R factor